MPFSCLRNHAQGSTQALRLGRSMLVLSAYSKKVCILPEVSDPLIGLDVGVSLRKRQTPIGLKRRKNPSLQCQTAGNASGYRLKRGAGTPKTLRSPILLGSVAVGGSSVPIGKNHERRQGILSGDHLIRIEWWSRTGSNRRPQACKASALPTELRPLFHSDKGSSPGCACVRDQGVASLVGLGRLELPTSRLSGVRSNHLSYRPDKPASIKTTPKGSV